MKCPFCAEDIRDAALLCRFCGAQKVGDPGEEHWQRPTAASAPDLPTPVKGQFTLRSAGALLILSAILEGISVTSAVPLGGELRGGVAAVAYHTLFSGVFLVMGIGLWSARRWGYQAVIGGTLVYLADRLVYLVDSGARTASARSQRKT